MCGDVFAPLAVNLNVTTVIVAVEKFLPAKGSGVAICLVSLLDTAYVALRFPAMLKSRRGEAIYRPLGRVSWCGSGDICACNARTAFGRRDRGITTTALP